MATRKSAKRRSPVTDGLQSMLANVGAGRDKMASARYGYQRLDDAQLMNAYRYAWLPRKIVDLPAKDATSKWRTWANDAAWAVEQRLQVRRRVLAALTSARLFGGAAIFIDTGSATLTNPLGEGETVQRLVVLQRNQVQLPLPDSADPLAPIGDICRVGEREIHKSRLVRFYGNRVPGDDDWADSVINACYDAVRNADGVSANVASMVFEAKIDIFKVPGLLDGLADRGFEDRVMRRMQLAQFGKSTTNALVMDAEEDFQQKQLNFGGLSDLQMTMLQIVAGASGIPATRLLGRSASGLNSTGDNEIREYYDTIRGEQELVIGPAMHELDMAIAREIGEPAPDYEWMSLWQMDDAQIADIRSKNAATLASLQSSAVFPDDVLYTAGVALLGETMPALLDEADPDAI